MNSKQIEQILGRAKASISNAYWTIDIVVDELNELGMRDKSNEVWQIESILSALEQQLEAIKQRYNELPF